MGVTAFHSRTATGADDPAYDVQLQRDWNAAHLLTLNAVGSEISNAFGNGGGVSFGFDGTNVTAQASAAPSPINISAGTTSNNLGSVVFSDSNGVGWGLNGSTITASYTQSTHAHTAWPLGFSAGTQTATSGTPGLANSNNFTFGMSGSSQITASFSESTHAHTAWPQAIQAGTQTATSGTVIFSNSNGISFGMSGTATITASYTVPTVTNSSWTVSDAATSGTVGRLAFTNLNGVTLSLSTGGGGSHTIVGSHNALTSQSNQAASAANGSFAFQTVSFSNVNGVSFGTSAGSAITASIATSLTNINVSAGTTSNNLSAITFSNSNGVSFGLSGSVITATVQPGAAAGIAALQNSQTTYTSGTVVLTEGGGAITIGSDTGQHFSFSVPQTSSIVGTSGITVSSAGSTISVQPMTESYFAFPPAGPDHHTQTWAPLSNTSYIWPVKIDDVVGFDYLKWLQTVSLASMASIATAANNTKSYTQQGTYNFMLYTRETGANSMSLTSYLSTSATSSMGITIGQNANGSQWTVTHAFAFPASNGTTSTSTSYATTLSNVNVSTTHLTFMTGVKFQAFPWTTTLTDAQYFVMHGLQTAQTTNGNASLSNMALTCSGLAYSLLNNAYADFGSVTNSSIGGVPGIGSFTKAATGTTAGLAFSNISTSASHLIPYITLQLIA